jgi:hypothetical protein
LIAPTKVLASAGIIFTPSWGAVPLIVVYVRYKLSMKPLSSIRRRW